VVGYASRREREEVAMIGALLLGFVAGVIARFVVPFDRFRKMSGPTSWAVSIAVGLAGALLGYLIFTVLLGIGDDDIFDWGGIIGALIGSVIVLGFLTYMGFRRRHAAAEAPPAPQAPPVPQAPPAPQAPQAPPVQP
jgi:uncharacterized membrane protein YeaQ/YmgE (transglycosylase-associated protein family)